MTHLDALSIGLILAVAGLGVWLLARLLAAAPGQRAAAAAILPDGDREHGEAVLVVQNGRVLQVSSAAAALLGLREGETPNLERIARRMRPPEAFLNVCASGVSDRLVLDGRLVECSAYRLAVTPNALVVVTLRDPGLASGLASGGGDVSSSVLQTYVDLSLAITGSLDLETTMLTVLENIQKLAPADWMQVGLWQPKQDSLVIYRPQGLENEVRSLERSNTFVRAGSGSAGRLVNRRQTICIEDVRAEGAEPLGTEGVEALLRAYLGVPLMAGGTLVGTLELGSMTPGAFREQEVRVIELLAGQAAMAIHNASQYAAEQQRTSELSGLTQLSQAVGAVRDPKTLFDQLVHSILPLAPVEILGFLLYNENQRMLEGQAPFHGLPEQFLEMYRVPVPPGSPLENALIEQDVLITENAAEDAQWEALGLGALARGASLRETLLIPLSSGGRMLGYLQAANHSVANQVFSADELRLLVIAANQAAPVIDNLTLVQQSRLRAQRAEALRRVASLASSAANLDEILKFSVQELARMLQADVGAVFLVDQNASELRFHSASSFGQAGRLAPGLGVLRMDDPQYPFTVTGRQHALVTGSLSAEMGVVPFYQNIQVAWGLESLVAVPLVVRDVGIGELWLGSSALHAFDKGSLQVAVTAAGQLAGVVEQSRLVMQTDESLRRRVEQLTSLTRISRALSTSADLRYLLQLVYDEALLTTRADCGTILLFDMHRPSPGGPRVRIYIGDPPAELSAWEKRALDGGEPVNIADTAAAGYPCAHDGIASALIVPVLYHQKQAGLIILHSARADCFDATAVEISQSLAVQAAVTLGNAMQYEEQAQQGEVLKRELAALNGLFEVARTQQVEMPVEKLLESAAEAIRAATPFQMVVISQYLPESGALRRVAGPGVPDDLWRELRSYHQPWTAVASLMQPAFKIGAAYFIPADRSPALPVEMHTVRALPQMAAGEADAWNPDDLLLIPLLGGADNHPLGLMSVDDPRDGRRPDWNTFEALELFALQISVLLQQAQAGASKENRLAELAASLDTLTIEVESARGRIPLMETREREQAGLIALLQQSAGRVQAGLEVMEAVAAQADSAAALRTVARELLARMQMQAALLAEKDEHGPRLMEAIGALPAATNPEALFGQRNPLRQALLDGSLLMVADVEDDSAWKGNAFLQALGARSFIAAPFALREGHRVALLAFASQARAGFTPSDQQIFERIGGQVSVQMQNLDALDKARRRVREMDTLVDFSRKLGSLDPADLLRALVQNALQIIPAGQGGWAGLWDEKQRELRVWAVSGYPHSDALLDMRMPWKDGEIAALPLPLRVFASGAPARVADLQFARDYNLLSEDLLRYRSASAGQLPVAAMVIPLQSGGHALGVLVLENFSSPDSFTGDDEALAVSLAQQTTLALENARLFQAAEGRAGQLLALTRMAARLTASLRSEELIAALLEHLRGVLPYDTATLWLREGNALSVADARGHEDDRAMLGITVSVDDSQLFNEMAASGRPIYVPDVRSDARFPTFTEPERISWLGIPLLAKAKLTGVIAVDKIEPGFYSEDHINAAATFAGQAAVALENARLFEESESRAIELDQRSRRLALINRLSGDLSATLDVDHIFALTMQDLINALGISRAAAVLPDAERDFVVQFETPAGPQALPLAFPQQDVAVFQRLQETQGVFHAADAADEPDLGAFYRDYLAPRGAHALLVVPLLAGANLHGWLALVSEKAERFSLAEIELARTICNQAAAAIQNARLFAETRRLTEDLERRVVERTAEVTREHHHSQTLLQISSELSASLDISMVLNRTLSVLNDGLGAEQSMVLLARGSDRPHQAGKDLAGGVGRPALRALAKETQRRRESLCISDTHQDAAYANDKFRSALAVPLALGEDVLGALLLFHSQPGIFGAQQVRLVEAAARQIGIAINNADLFNLIRDQAENLGGMLRAQQVEASRSRAILEAVADGVLVTDAANTINLFNASAGRILQLDAAQVLDKSLEGFSGLFGKAASAWMQTIRGWSADPKSYAQDALYSERLELEQGRVVEVHLAPVFLRSEFLGTVSIFRDITHEVRVDRLKSEFVANVSHELRTPMTSIKGYVDVMLMGVAGDLDPRIEHFLRIIKGNTERLSILVNDLLDVEKIDSGRARLEFQPVNLRQVAAEVIASMRERSQEEKRPMRFVLEMAENLPFVRADLERVRQMLGALVTNGYLYTPDGGAVTVRACVEEDDLRVDVVDNGIGITPQDQPRLFERFYRGEDPLVLASAGTGLGLSITRALVEMHGGRIWFKSSGVRGEGSVFSFTLPVYDRAVAALGGLAQEAGSA